MSLAVRDIQWSIGSTPILNGVDLQLQNGRLCALLGPNGSGKSSLLRILTGVHRAAAARPAVSGSAFWNGADLLGMRPRARARLLAFVEQDVSPDVEMSVHDAVLLGRTPHRSALSGQTQHDRDAVERAIALTALEGFAGRSIATLSGGERQRVHLARALAQEPELLVLDEPTNHLDISAQLATLGLLRELVRSGTTVLLALHDLNLASSYCDDVVMLSGGRSVAAGAPHEVLVPEVVDHVYGVRTSVLTHPDTGANILSYGPRPALEREPAQQSRT